MVGMGETGEEVLRTLDDLREAGCDRGDHRTVPAPYSKHWAVAEYVSHGIFAKYKEEALAEGFFLLLRAHPWVRSSYLAEEALGSCRSKPAEVQ